MDKLLAKLSEQQTLLEQQKTALEDSEHNTSQPEHDESISSSVPLTPATESFNVTPGTSDNDEEKTIQLDPAEMIQLKKELDAAKDKIARQEEELSQTRIIKHTFDHAKDQTVDATTAHKRDSIDHTIANIQGAYHTSNRPMSLRQGSFGNYDDTRSDISDALSAGTFNRAQNIWSTNTNPGYNFGLSTTLNQHAQPPTQIWGQAGRPWGNRPMAPALAPLMMPQQQQVQHRTYSSPTSPSSSAPRLGNDFNQFLGGQGLRRSNTQNSRSGSAFIHNRNPGWDTYGGNVDGSTIGVLNPASPFQSMGMFQAPLGYQPRPIGTPLSPTAAEFTASGITNNPWNASVSLELEIPQTNLTTTPGTFVSWADLCLSNGTSELPASTRS